MGGDVLDDIIRAMSLVLDFDEKKKLQHAWRVAVIAQKIAETMGFGDSAMMYYAGLLHDIGAVGIRDHIVHHIERGELTEAVRNHGRVGAEILRSCRPFRKGVALWIEDHHERFDGTGFPEGKRGDQISTGGAILHLADMVEIRLRSVAHGASLNETAAAYIKKRIGTFWPEEIADAGLRVLEKFPTLLDECYDDAMLEKWVFEISPNLVISTDDRCPDGIEQIIGFLMLFARIIDAKHNYTFGHSVRVFLYLREIVNGVTDWDGKKPTDWEIATAGLLHDAGKVGVPRDILDKEGHLNREEVAVIRRHVEATDEIVSGIRALAHLAPVVAAHHENFDGSGYPAKTSGNEIPLLGRMLAIADSYDAMTSDRAYRMRLPHDVAVARLRKGNGTQFDPDLIETAVAALDAMEPITPRTLHRLPFHGDAYADEKANADKTDRAS